MEYINQNLIAVAALAISVLTYFGARRSTGKYATIHSVNMQIAKLEAEVKKLQDGLDRCIKERIAFKEEISALKKALKVSKIEVEELKESIEEGDTHDQEEDLPPQEEGQGRG